MVGTRCLLRIAGIECFTASLMCRSSNRNSGRHNITAAVNHSHKDSGSMGSRDGVEERGTILMRGFYKAGTKMTPRFRDGIGVPGSRNGTLDPGF